MTQLQNELKNLEKIVGKSVSVDGGMSDWSHIEIRGCLTLAQCALVPLLHSRDLGRDVSEDFELYWNLALLDVYTKKLQVKHPKTMLPLSEYMRLNLVNKVAIPIIDPQWLVNLDECERWLLSKGISIDLSELKNTPSKESSKQDIGAEPWLEPDPKDPEPEQDWYTPARYFARQLVRDDSALLTKRKLLAQKVVQSLSNVKIYKRGKKLPHSYTTILKALSNVSLG